MVVCARSNFLHGANDNSRIPSHRKYIRSDVYSSRASIDVMKLLGATDQFILRPYLYTGMIYAVLGGFVAAVFSSLIVGYFTSAVSM